MPKRVNIAAHVCTLRCCTVAEITAIRIKISSSENARPFITDSVVLRAGNTNNHRLALSQQHYQKLNCTFNMFISSMNQADYSSNY